MSKFRFAGVLTVTRQAPRPSVLAEASGIPSVGLQS